MDDDDDKPGIGKNGKPYKPHNTRPDGSYLVGKFRTSEHTRFKPDDNRRRGRRSAGTKNLMTDFAEELGTKIKLKENGKVRKHTKQRAIVKVVIEKAIQGNGRAIDTVLAQSLRLAGLGDELRDKGLTMTDQEIVEAFVRRKIEELRESDQENNGPLPAPDTIANVGPDEPLDNNGGRRAGAE